MGDSWPELRMSALHQPPEYESLEQKCTDHGVSGVEKINTKFGDK